MNILISNGFKRCKSFGLLINKTIEIAIEKEIIKSKAIIVDATYKSLLQPNETKRNTDGPF